MKLEEQKSILVIALYAAFADGIKEEGEREEVRRIAASLADVAGGIDLAGLYQDVLLKRTSLAAAATLTEAGQRQLAYEMAVCVCEADGRLCDAERRFLNELKVLLELDSAATERVEHEIDSLAGDMESAVPPATAGTKAAAGVGLTSQYLEQFGRKLLGGLLGKVAGKTVGKLGGAATGMAFSFATTYALGQVARRYYAGGRTMSSEVLRDSFQNLLEPAKQMQAQYLPQIRQQAATLDVGQIMDMVRGKHGAMA